jgi:hypothetical protein
MALVKGKFFFSFRKIGSYRYCAELYPGRIQRQAGTHMIEPRKAGQKPSKRRSTETAARPAGVAVPPRGAACGLERSTARELL